MMNHDEYDELLTKAHERLRAMSRQVDNPLQVQLLDLITLMPDSQTQELLDYILLLRKIRAR